MPRRTILSPAAIALAAAWLALTTGFAAFAVYSGVQQAERDMEETGRALHRIMSQRAAQHDAHLTSLGALAQAANPPPLREIEQVATSIIRFYPRITAIDLIALPHPGAGGDARSIASTLGPDGRAADPAATARAIEDAQRGAAVFVASEFPGRYRLLKKPSDDVALNLEIDAARLFDAEELPGWAALRLATGDGLIVDIPASASPAFGALIDVSFDARLASASQPLLLGLKRRVAIGDVISPWPILLVGFGALAIVAAAALGLRQRRAAIVARAAANEALRREDLRRHEARLAHALRVNAMGEMASGIAHELNQPLTALLSQSQAGARLVASSELAGSQVADVLAANVRQAKRAADILDRLRAYVSKRPIETRLCDLNALVVDIVALSRIDMERRDIALSVSLATPPPTAWADPVQIEQVVHNLIRNGADALDRGAQGVRMIEVRTAADDREARIEVVDNGAGVPQDVLPRLFEPFFSTKPDGMGLGLPLCERIAERFGGRMAAANRAEGGAIFTLALPLAAAERRDEAAE